MPEVPPIVVEVRIDHQEADRRIKNLAATATGLRLLCDRLEQRLTELDAQAERLAKSGIPNAARAVAKGTKRG